MRHTTAERTLTPPQMAQLMRELTLRERVILTTYMHGLTINEIAEMVHVPRVLAEVELDVARRVMRQLREH